MTIKELEERLNPGAILSLAAGEKIKAIGKNKYRIEPCPICQHKDHFTIYGDTNSYTSFSDCTKGGGAYRFMLEVLRLSEEQARQKLEEMAGIYPDVQRTEKKSAPTMDEAMIPELDEPMKDYTELTTKLYNNQLHETKQYFIGRGVGQNLIDHYKLSVFHDQDGRRAMLPVWKDGKVIYFTKRSLDGQDPRYKNATGTAHLFNAEELEKAGAGDVILITEGIFDALSIEETSGIKAVALGGDQHYNKAEEAIKAARDRKVIILTAFDNDGAGRRATETANLPSISIPGKYKDINEWSIDHPSATREAIQAEILKITRPESAINYLETEFYKAIDTFKNYQGKPTGFSNLDHYLGGFFPGLYVIGGVSSVGKTTFVHQLGDQLAERGDHVLYFSLEQSRFEMISKSLARETAKIDLMSAVKNIDIRSGLNVDMVSKAVKSYKETAKRMNVIEGNFDTTVEKIKTEVKNYIIRNKVRPVVIVDYLQILPGDPRMSDKTRIDTNVTELKRISRKYEIPVLVISSLNRTSYTTPVSFEAFKETGGIEYTADVVIGLQLQAIREKICDPTERHDILEKAKQEIPRKIELVCLKNRNGRSFSCNFQYNQLFDYYSSETLADRKPKRL